MKAVTQDRTQCAPKWRIEEPDGVVTVTPDTNDVALWRAQIAAALGIRDRDAQQHLVFAGRARIPGGRRGHKSQRGDRAHA